MLFVRVGTQWRSSMAGYYGLDYNVVIRLLERMGVDDAEFSDMLDNIRVMELEALKVIREDSK